MLPEPGATGPISSPGSSSFTPLSESRSRADSRAGMSRVRKAKCVRTLGSGRPRISENRSASFPSSTRSSELDHSSRSKFVVHQRALVCGSPTVRLKCEIGPSATRAPGSLTRSRATPQVRSAISLPHDSAPRTARPERERPTLRDSCRLPSRVARPRIRRQRPPKRSARRRGRRDPRAAATGLVSRREPAIRSDPALQREPARGW